VRGGPRRSRGVPGVGFGRNHWTTGPKISSQTAFRYLEMSGAFPGDLGGVPGVGFGRKSLDNPAKNLQPDCLQVLRKRNKKKRGGATARRHGRFGCGHRGAPKEVPPPRFRKVGDCLRPPGYCRKVVRARLPSRSPGSLFKVIFGGLRLPTMTLNRCVEITRSSLGVIFEAVFWVPEGGLAKNFRAGFLGF